MPLEVIAQFMDFNIKQHKLIQEEFNHKYTGTILKVNDNYTTVSGCACTPNHCTIFGKDPYDPVSIEEWNPEVGIYLHKDRELLFISRLPERQYLKSFKLGANYNVEKIYSSEIRQSLFNLNPNDLKFLGIHCIFNNTFYLFKHEIGLVERKNIFLFPDYFKKFSRDIEELCPNYNITSLTSMNLQSKNTGIKINQVSRHKLV